MPRSGARPASTRHSASRRSQGVPCTQASRRNPTCIVSPSAVSSAMMQRGSAWASATARRTSARARPSSASLTRASRRARARARARVRAAEGRRARAGAAAAAARAGAPRRGSSRPRGAPRRSARRCPPRSGRRRTTRPPSREAGRRRPAWTGSQPTTWETCTVFPTIIDEDGEDEDAGQLEHAPVRKLALKHDRRARR